MGVMGSALGKKTVVKKRPAAVKKRPSSASLGKTDCKKQKTGKAPAADVPRKMLPAKYAALSFPGNKNGVVPDADMMQVGKYKIYTSTASSKWRVLKQGEGNQYMRV